jgi:glycerol-3-phosphate cytidylyltransferase
MRVITYGTFDTLHYGHIRLLKRARELGSHLTVGLSTDEFNSSKGKSARFDWEQRKADLEAISYVDEVIPERNWEQKASDVETHEIDIFTIGDDWKGKFDFLSDQCKVVYLGRTEDISSTMIRNLSDKNASAHLAHDNDAILRTQNLHERAMASLMSSSVKFKGHRAFSELKAIKTSPPTKEWLEAFIMVGALKVGRPYNMLSAINQLRDMAKTKTEKKDFETFHQAIAKRLSPILLTNHGFINPEKTFAQASHDEVWAGIRSHMQVLNKAGFKVFLASGPLLGLTRDGKLIDHDNDFDLGLILDATTEEEAAAAWKAIPGKLVKTGIFSEGSESNHGLVRLLPVDGFTIDVFPAWFSDDKAYLFPHTYGDLKPEDVYPFKTCEITGVNLPAEPEKMLEINYGPNWRTYDPLWKFQRPSGFDSFLKRIPPVIKDNAR